jgi:hypothetical protein
VLQRNWEKEQNFGFYANDECRVFAEEKVFECFPATGKVETRKSGDIRGADSQCSEEGEHDPWTEDTFV